MLSSDFRVRIPRGRDVLIPRLSQQSYEPRRILVASNEPVYRAGLAAVVDQMGDYCAFGASAEPAAVVESLQEARTFAALALVDDVPRTLSLIACIRDQWPSIPVILVVTESHQGLLQRGLRMGIAGVLVPTSSPCEIRAALSAVETGGVFLSHDALQLLGESIEPIDDVAPAASALSPRQREVLALVAQGRSTAEIALALGVSRRTIDSHRLAISKRLSLRNVADLIRYALRENLVPS